MRGLSSSLLLIFSCASGQALAVDCSGSRVPQPLPVRSTGLPPAAVELGHADGALGVSAAPLAVPGDEAQSVDRVLLRLRLEGCQNVAAADPATGYVPKTQFDNTPYRFNAQKGFTAAEFEAWMKARGIRIATGKPKAADPAAAPVAAAQPPCQQGATTC